MITSGENGIAENLADNSYYLEITKRLQVIDKELIRLIEAKKRYEIELEEIMKELTKNNKPK
jgi:hypothetical protein